MAILLEFDSRQKVAHSLLQLMLDSGFVRKIESIGTVSKSKEPRYNPEFVKMIKEAHAEPKTRLTPELKKKYFGDL